MDNFHSSRAIRRGRNKAELLTLYPKSAPSPPSVLYHIKSRKAMLKLLHFCKIFANKCELCYTIYVKKGRKRKLPYPSTLPLILYIWRLTSWKAGKKLESWINRHKLEIWRRRAGKAAAAAAAISWKFRGKLDAHAAS